MFRDGPRAQVWDQIRQRHLPAFNRLLTREVVIEAARLAGDAVGDSPLSILMLPWLAVSAALHVGKSFADVLVVALKILSDQPGCEKSPLGRHCAVPRHCPGKKRGQRGKKGKQPVPKNKHDPRGHWLGAVTEEAFAQARKRLPLSFWAWLLIVLAQRLEAAHPQADRWKEFRLLMLDGTHVPLARWKGLINYFGTAKNGKKKAHQRPQARMVMLAFAQTRTPWRYEVTPVGHPRAGDRAAPAGGSAGQRSGADGPRLLELWPVLANCSAKRFLRDSVAEQYSAEDGQAPGLWRPVGHLAAVPEIAAQRAGFLGGPASGVHPAGGRLPDSRLPQDGRGDHRAGPQAGGAARLGSAGGLRRRRPGDRGGAVSSPLGYRNPVLRVEDPPSNGPSPAGADARLEPLRNCRA